MKVMNNVLMASLVLGLSLNSVDAAKQSTKKASKANRKEVAAMTKAKSSAELVAAIKAKNPEANVELIAGNRIKLNGKVTVKADVQAFLNEMDELVQEGLQVADERANRAAFVAMRRQEVLRVARKQAALNLLAANTGTADSEDDDTSSVGDIQVEFASFNEVIHDIYNDYSARIWSMVTSEETAQAAQVAQAALSAGLTRYLLPTVGLVVGTAVAQFGLGHMPSVEEAAMVQGAAAAMVLSGNLAYNAYNRANRVNTPVEESKSDDKEVVNETSLVIYEPRDNA